MARSAPKPIPDHPLLADRPRLDRILNVMYAEIQKVTHRGTRPEHRAQISHGGGTERTLVGGESAEDVLQDALLALLSYEPARLTSTWEALAVGIAQKKAVGAVRRATKGRRARTNEDGEQETEINVVPLPTVGTDDDDAIGDLPSANDDLEDEFIRTEQQLILRDLARELLDERDRRIFYDIHYLDVPAAEIGRQLDLSGQRVGQIYKAVLQRLLLAARSHPMFRRISDYPDLPQGGRDDQLK